MSRQQNLAVCKENRDIINNNGYIVNGNFRRFPNSLKSHQSVVVLHPKFVEASCDSEFSYDASGIISVVNADSLHRPTQLVLNFANAYHPGGGYLYGSPAQEECLCRQSTLYASISSDQAAEMYKANKQDSSLFNTPYMLLSPCVDVFRAADLQPMEEPWTCAVITAAAPDLKDPKAMLVTPEQIEEAMLQKIRNLLSCAAAFNYKYITLGAWGCGAFGHDAANVSEWFRQILIGEGMRFLFDSIEFAVLDRSESKYNYQSFCDTFIDCI